MSLYLLRTQHDCELLVLWLRIRVGVVVGEICAFARQNLASQMLISFLIDFNSAQSYPLEALGILAIDLQQELGRARRNTSSRS